ncbi:MAG: hypothetical protein GWN99_14045 [Gemmatimonadetes bacterium]|uniref:LTXXQ motif family protein n=1 Tax=Candidatus Kutchimonas denitrificans TaxID=3056748 RepID=A0AAE5CCQ1_9BACT|nr:hypothetical protein [Gemmatimonadota bacterium]NIR75975.1 hypothetical protein [Candidatus Kutchimonas denitrificans]NIS02167.1 hypothetical protein [Gemmatimonadota bacterium]NIT67993.1 hypothetical protein [Gemmatimonadota bacterium]NIU54019.1 hypothetical protein [Gemmatimonadota bacterium]
MRTLRRSAATAGMAGLLLLGAIAATQQQDRVPKVDVEELAAELGLSQDVKQQIAPEIERLDELFTRRTEDWENHMQLHDQWVATFRNIDAALTPEQQRQFRIALHEAWGYGPGAGMRGQTMHRQGHMMYGGGHMHGGRGSGGTCPGLGSGPHGAMHHGPFMVPPAPGSGS